MSADKAEAEKRKKQLEEMKKKREKEYSAAKAAVKKFKSTELNADNMPAQYIKYKGVWDMQGLFETVADYMRQNKFSFYETFQRHRRPGPFGVERKHTFNCEGRIDHYHMGKIKVDLETFDEQDIEVVENGVKKTLTKGRLIIQITFDVIWDYAGVFEKNYFLLHLRKFFHRYTIRKRIEVPYVDTFYFGPIIKLQNLLTEHLNLETRRHGHLYGAGLH